MSYPSPPALPRSRWRTKRATTTPMTSPATANHVTGSRQSGVGGVWLEGGSGATSIAVVIANKVHTAVAAVA